ncbi:MAG: ribonuclease P protein component [Acidobacteria bacterium]|nr:ribonuclease P protein component [Acidobacteriota bacterium]NIM63188.1 ribonuclease P protein component [Acidobacteriota bacterium]NIO58409.1 ribonuclease P protein component [Acidobacteriota bacterium]NIQ29457.1 ribonuclease P protein component [Acidobacteriota bacterium]NIQ84109.1 ribonuclease P protein component [Acidobacteriota bacterium]
MSLPVVVEKGGRVSRPDPAAAYSFPRTDRLTSRRQFLAVYERGRRERGRLVTVFGLENRLGRCRVGLTVTRRLGSAVVRNRTKRVLREIFRLHRLAEAGSLDIVINAHVSLPEHSRTEIERDVLECVERLKRGGRR